MKIAVRMSFIGMGFYGTQKQKSFRTVQNVFEKALKTLYEQEIKSTICSRLDRGVNAKDFLISFIAPDKRVTLEHLKYYLSRALGIEFFIKSVRIVPDSFSARYSCDYKVYVYTIQNGKERNPLLNPTSYAPMKRMDYSKIKEALPLFEGKHDFRQFATPESPDENTVLSIDETKVTFSKGLIKIYFKGQSFLRYQVRFMVGCLIRYATSKITLEDINTLLSGKTLNWQKLKADPQGLTLLKIHYPSLDK